MWSVSNNQGRDCFAYVDERISNLGMHVEANQARLELLEARVAVLEEGARNAKVLELHTLLMIVVLILLVVPERARWMIASGGVVVGLIVWCLTTPGSLGVIVQWVATGVMQQR